MSLQKLIESLTVTDEQLEKVSANRLKFQSHLKFKFDFINIISKDLKYLYVSEMGARYLGLKPINMIGKHWRELNVDLPFEDFERLDEKIIEVFNTGSVIYENLAGGSNIQGQDHYFEYLISPIVTSSGDIEAVMCNVTDITERILSEITLSEQVAKFNQLIELCPPVSQQPTGDIVGAAGISSNIAEHEKFREENQKKQQELLNQYLTENKKLNQLIELCPLGIVLYDNKGNVIALNKAHRECMKNLKNEDFLGKKGKYLLETLGLTWENSPCYQALQGIETLNYYQKSTYGACYLINAIPLRNYENTIIGAMTIIHDITEYERLKEDMARLDRLNLVGEMAAGVAHEVRNPMTVIKGYLQFLSKKVPESMMEQFCIILNELERIEHIITDFLSLAGNKLIEYKKQDLNNIIKGILPLISTNAMERGIEMNLNLTEGLPHLMLNEKEIKQLLLNLARNGIEAMSQHGTLTIETSVEGAMVSLCIADCGCGIRKENHEKIFDPFFTTKETGTGLGLSVSASIVRRHNGTIEVESEENKGTRFIITFNTMGFAYL